jgi:phytanoyl-CoA hydroxylase
MHNDVDAREALADPQVVRDAYQRDGYVIIRNAVPADLIADADGHVRWLVEQYPDRRPEQLTNELVADDPFWVRLVSDERLVDLAEIFLGPDIALFATHYISKPPFTGQAVRWHQDGAYWPLEPMEVVTFWLSVDHSTPENGCLRVIPGSHKQDLQGIREVADGDNVLGSEIDSVVDESKAVDLVLAPGDLEVHHPNILHASSANTSPNRRCGLTIRYIPTSTRITSDEQPFPSAMLLRGNPGANVYQQPPTYSPERHFPAQVLERELGVSR